MGMKFGSQKSLVIIGVCLFTLLLNSVLLTAVMKEVWLHAIYLLQMAIVTGVWGITNTRKGTLPYPI